MEVLCLSTDQLIRRFYSDIVNEEAIKEFQFDGELVFSVGYIKETSLVEVNVIQTKDIGN